MSDPSTSAKKSDNYKNKIGWRWRRDNQKLVNNLHRLYKLLQLILHTQLYSDLKVSFYNLRCKPVVLCNSTKLSNTA